MPLFGNYDMNPLHGGSAWYAPFKSPFVKPLYEPGHGLIGSLKNLFGGGQDAAPKLHGGGMSAFNAQSPVAPAAPTGGGMLSFQNALAAGRGGGVNRGAISALAAALVNAQMGPLALQEAQARTQARQDLGRGRSITQAQKRSARQTMRQQQALTNQSLASAAQESAGTEAGRQASSEFLNSALADFGGGPYEGGPTAAEVAGGSAAAGGARRAADMGAGFREFAGAARDVAQTGGSEYARDVLGQQSSALANLGIKRAEARAQQPSIFMELMQQAQAQADARRQRQLEMYKMLAGAQGGGPDMKAIRGMLMGKTQNVSQFATDAHGNTLTNPNTGAPLTYTTTNEGVGAPDSYAAALQQLIGMGVDPSQAATLAQQYGYTPGADTIHSTLAQLAQSMRGGM